MNAEDFAVCRIEAQPAKNPSLWIKRIDIHHAYLKVGDFRLPQENKSVSITRLGGRATLSIEIQKYEILSADPLPETAGGSSASRCGWALIRDESAKRIPPLIAVSSYHFSETGPGTADCDLGTVTNCLGAVWR